ncbi:hypothetical protein RBB50_012886 [Rhinocladiella similis]
MAGNTIQHSDCGGCNTLMRELARAKCDLQWCFVRLNQGYTRNLYLSSNVTSLETTLSETQATLHCAMDLLQTLNSQYWNVQTVGSIWPGQSSDGSESSTATPPRGDRQTQGIGERSLRSDDRLEAK